MTRILHDFIVLVVWLSSAFLDKMWGTCFVSNYIESILHSYKEEMLMEQPPSAIFDAYSRRSVARDYGKQQVSNVRNFQALRENRNVPHLHKPGISTFVRSFGNSNHAWSHWNTKGNFASQPLKIGRHRDSSEEGTRRQVALENTLMFELDKIVSMPSLPSEVLMLGGMQILTWKRPKKQDLKFQMWELKVWVLKLKKALKTRKFLKSLKQKQTCKIWKEDRCDDPNWLPNGFKCRQQRLPTRCLEGKRWRKKKCVL